MRLASQLYQRLALRRPSGEINRAAQKRLSEIKSVAVGKWQTVEDQLQQLKGSQKDALRPAHLDPDQVTNLFAELETLAAEYAGVATVDNKFEDRLTSLRNDQKFAAILREPAAEELWKAAQQLEKDQQVCCAVFVYEKAAELAPAESARKARERLTQLNADKGVVAAAERCRVLQLCHDKFRLAEAMKRSHPERAREHYARIVELAPPETPIHRAAREQFAMLQ